MDYIWEFFEGLDEMVYVTDMETDEIVYMNQHLRKFLGIQSRKDYDRQKCYQILQGRDSPCPFCTNSKLVLGEFLTWTHKNPVLNKSFLVKDTTVEYQGRQYRVEIAIDKDAEQKEHDARYSARSETILNGCLNQLVATMDPEESIENVLAFLGETFQCDRTFLFETKEPDRVVNTYEWCGESVSSQKEQYQHEKLQDVVWWIEKFKQEKTIIIDHLEQIRAEHPETYAELKKRKIARIAVCPIGAEEQMTGFLGVENPGQELLPLIAPLLHIIGYFFLSLLRRRDLLARLENLSYHDPLTGALNRNAMSEYRMDEQEMQSTGVIYCDISGLKEVNDTLGHDAGDEVIRHCYQLIRDTTKTEWIYRTGGDEFVAVLPNCSEEAFQHTVEILQEGVQQDKYHIAVGYVWSDQQPMSLESMISKADKVMYKDKRDYYEKRRMLQGIDRRHPPKQEILCSGESESSFHQFISSTYCDVEAIFHSISDQNSSSYFYFGDMQKNLFYISDNMRSEFGFDHNVVPDLIHAWESRISTPKFQELYRQEIGAILAEKRTIHDLCYQVRTASGENMWVRCYGILKWNEDKSAPQFFSGRITHQDNGFLIDPVTNFPKVSSLFHSLRELGEQGGERLLIGFSLNNITEINHTRGRFIGDHLMRNIADLLMEELSDKLTFYRLEGAKCVALADSGYTESAETLVQEIRRIVEKCYCEEGFPIHCACSFGVMKYPDPSLREEDLQERLVSLLKMAKRETTKSYTDYSTECAESIKQMSKMELALNQDVMRGMEHFRMVIQPLVSAKDGSITGGESLLRWNFDGKDVSPEIFIPMLEKGDMIHLVGRWVVEQSVKNCKQVLPYLPEFHLSFNVSLRQLTDEKFADIIRETLEKFQVDGRHMIAEVTESCIDKESEKLSRFMDQCDEAGIKIALDDFGSGYSSMQMLLRYPCSIIKLDRSLLWEITESEGNQQFIRSIVYGCHQFGKVVCAEGVESAEQNEIIRETGCDVIQGYYYHRPMEWQNFFGMVTQL